MSEDKSKKTEQPTKRSLQEARKKGQIAKSKEIVSTGILFFSSIYFYLFWESHIQIIQNFITFPQNFYDHDFSNAVDIIFITLFFNAIKYIIAPIVFLLFFIAILFNVFQFGIIFSFEPITPKIEKINPISGFSKVFSTKTLTETALSLLKIILIGATSFYVIYTSIKSFPPDLSDCDLACFVIFLQKSVLKLMSLIIPLFIILSILDYMLQKHEFIKEQKMTKEEFKRHFKDTEGDPFIKSMRKSIHIQSIHDDFIDRIKQSKVIITDYNYGIAIAYESDRMALPVVVSKSNGVMLSRMLSVARLENVPIHEDTPLTHILSDDGEIDAYIPYSTVDKIASIMREVNQPS